MKQRNRAIREGTCVDCGNVFVKRASRSKRCDPCQKEYHKEYLKEYHKTYGPKYYNKNRRSLLDYQRGYHEKKKRETTAFSTVKRLPRKTHFNKHDLQTMTPERLADTMNKILKKDAVMV